MPTLKQKLQFLEMYETHREKHVFSRVREGPVAQVRVTWAQKSCPKDVGTAKSCLGGASQRDQDGKGRFGLTVGVMGIIAPQLQIGSGRSYKSI